MRDDLLKILNMVKEGKLEAQKAADLIEAIAEKKSTSIQVKTYNERMLRVLIESVEGDNVRVNLPVNVIISMLKVSGKLPIKNEYMEGIDLEMLSITLISALENETLGEIVTVDSSKGDIVRVLVE